LFLGLFAVGLSWYVRRKTNIARLASWTSGIGFALGVGVLLLMLVFVQEQYR
jgi:ABC-type lipoprotein release transport system permease subunit